MKVVAPVSDVARAQDRVISQREKPEGLPSLNQELKVQNQESKAQGQASREDLRKIVDKMNSAAQLFSRALQFKMLEGNRLIIKVVDTTTDEVLSEFPPERLIEAFRSMEASLGLLVDKKV